MDVIGEGSTSLIKISGQLGYVEKRYKRPHRLRLAPTEKEIHAQISPLLEKAKSPLRTPILLPHLVAYVMEEVKTDRPLWHEEVWSGLSKHIQETLLSSLKTAFKALWAQGYNMRDVEVYLQPDNTLVVLDFGQVTMALPSEEFSLQSAAVVPPEVAKLF